MKRTHFSFIIQFFLKNYRKMLLRLEITHIPILSRPRITEIYTIKIKLEYIVK